VGAALGRADFAALDAPARLAVLHDALAAGAASQPPASGDEALIRSLNVMRAITGCRASHGDAAIGGYIISMAEDADDVLAVLYLARLAGLSDASGRVPLDLVPLFETVEMVLAKADMRIAQRYARLAGALGEELFPALAAEYRHTCKLVCDIHGVASLLEREPQLERTLRLRAPYLDPMSLMQLDLLVRWRAGGRSDAALELALAETVRGIARGMQNAG
jgi:phosphoenolpyruvate carboxylase